MRELSLFSGAGGRLLATQHLMGWETIGYVEIDEYCQRVLRQRIDDGFLDRAPIFTDVREFLESGAAREYRGVADVVTGGFPCQPWSQAGQRTGLEHREGGLWSVTRRIIDSVRPAHVFLENVLGVKKLLPQLVQDLRGMGYCVPRRAVVGASSVGSGHIRKRVWISAHSNCRELWKPERRWGRKGREDTEKLERNPWWSSEPGVDRVAHGIPNAMDRLKALGNGQVPAVAQAAWEILV